IAGADTAVCSVNSTTLGATAPLVGSGSWSIVSGVGGSIAQPNNPNSTFSGQYNKPYVLEWTTSNGGCVFSDQVTVIFVNTNYSPGRIAGFSGQTSAVCGLTQTYAAIPNHPYATYSWSGYPAGTTVNLQSGNQITLTYPSSGFNYFQLKVTSTVCGVQTPIRSVAMKGAPSVKVANGPAIVCANATGIVYNVDLLAGVTYNWSVPQGATIVNGQGTNEITVDWGNSGGLVLCNIWNSCGSSTAKKSVTTNCRSAQQTLTESNSTLISIFPNPSSGVFNLHADNQLENVQITVTDLQGRTLINTLFTGNETTVDLSNYTQGVYMLQLHSNKEVQTYKLIKD
ncbi:MAG TPA: T9SS type A sorting domain-containing protein, partial [Bacteroidia bacterium]|nr:T9SS type A sorting domain-containing protein [Bacteroidia bacterium]